MRELKIQNTPQLRYIDSNSNNTTTSCFNAGYTTTMDAIQREHEKLSQLIRHPKPLDEARNMLSLLENAKQNIENSAGNSLLIAF